MGLRRRCSYAWVIGALLGSVTSSGAIAKPVVRTLVLDRYVFEARSPGDGAPIVHVADEVPEPLFLHLTDERFTVWWRARHTCDKTLEARVHVQGDRLALDVTAQRRQTAKACVHQATVFETVVESWGRGPREVTSDGATGDIASLWVSFPSPSRPQEMGALGDRVREDDVRRRLGERIAWRYHLEGDTRATIAAYRWLVSLDHLHWRTPLYHARIFHNAAFNRTKGGALAALEALVPGVERLRERIAEHSATAAPHDAELADMKRELAALEAFLEPALRYLALRWHNQALHRWQAPSRAYDAYLRLFPTSESAPTLRFFYGSALLQSDDANEAKTQFRLAAAAAIDEGQRELAAACAVVLELDDRSWKQLAPCRAPRPKTPPLETFPKVADERFATGAPTGALPRALHRTARP